MCGLQVPPKSAWRVGQFTPGQSMGKGRNIERRGFGGRAGWSARRKADNTAVQLIQPTSCDLPKSFERFRSLVNFCLYVYPTK